MTKDKHLSPFLRKSKTRLVKAYPSRRQETTRACNISHVKKGFMSHVRHLSTN